jgi:hypothetical protein
LLRQCTGGWGNPASSYVEGDAVIPGRAAWREPGIQASTFPVVPIEAWIPGSLRAPE